MYFIRLERNLEAHGVSTVQRIETSKVVTGMLRVNKLHPGNGKEVVSVDIEAYTERRQSLDMAQGITQLYLLETQVGGAYPVEVGIITPMVKLVVVSVGRESRW